MTRVGRKKLRRICVTRKKIKFANKSSRFPADHSDIYAARHRIFPPQPFFLHAETSFFCILRKNKETNSLCVYCVLFIKLIELKKIDRNDRNDDRNVRYRNNNKQLTFKSIEIWSSV